MRNRFKRLLRTTAVKLSLRYSLVYIVIFGVAFLVLYWSVTAFVEDQIKVELKRDAKRIEKLSKNGGTAAVKKYILSHERFKGEDHKYYLLVDKYGKVVAGDLKKWPESLKVGEPIKNIWVSKRNIVGKVPDGDGLWPMLAIALKDGSKVLIAQGIKGTEDVRETLFTIMVVIFGFIVVLLILLGLSMGENILSHAEGIEVACGSIIGGDLSKRIPISEKNDEFDMIAKHINTMLDELERFIKQSRESADNIAHDLKTPLNRIRNRLEMMVLGKEEKSSESLGKLIEDVDRMVRMINALLEISRIETGALRKNWDEVDLPDVVEEALEFYRPIAEEKKIDLSLKIEKDAIVNGNRHLISQSILNLLDNAIKYTQKWGRVGVSIETKDNKVIVSVCDDGPGVDEKYYTKLTKKFFRFDKSRKTIGNGLGLSFVKAVTELHNAELIFKNNNPGLCVEMRFRNL